MYAHSNYGLGQVDEPNISFLSGSVLTALALGIGIIILFKVMNVEEKPKRKKDDRKAYARYVGKVHGLSQKDIKYLEEYED